MSTKTDKLDKLIVKIRDAEPILHDADFLTDRIMYQIENQAPRLESRLIIWIRAVSSTAAIFLVGLFIFQQIASKNSEPCSNKTQFIETKINMDSVYNLKAINEQNSLMKAYLCYMQQNTNENNQLKKYHEQLYD